MIFKSIAIFQCTQNTQIFVHSNWVWSISFSLNQLLLWQVLYKLFPFDYFSWQHFFDSTIFLPQVILLSSWNTHISLPFSVIDMNSMFHTSWTMLSPSLLSNSCTITPISVGKMPCAYFEKLIIMNQKDWQRKKLRIETYWVSDASSVLPFLFALDYWVFSHFFCMNLKETYFEFCAWFKKDLFAFWQQCEVNQIFYTVLKWVSVNMPHQDFCETYSGSFFFEW